MKRVILGMAICTLNTFADSHLDNITYKEYRAITIEKSISVKEIEVYKRDGKEMGLEVIENPQFTCLSVGYEKKDLLEKGTLYGSRDKDGNTIIGKEGDFLVYDFEKYFKNGHFCVETTYKKDDERYGEGSVALLTAIASK